MSHLTASRPGVLLEVLGRGVLLQGPSGIGKSDLALGLVARGHRLVADDMVEFERRDGHLQGRCPGGFEGLIEVAGLGLVDVRQLHGEQALCASAALSLVLLLEPHWPADYDGLQPPAADWQLLGVLVPAWRLHCSPRRDMSLIVETALRLQRAGAVAPAARLSCGGRA